MNTLAATRAATAPLTDDDERSLLIRLDLLLEREEEMLAARDVVGLVDLSTERERLTERLAEAARVRRAGPKGSDADEAELIELYRLLRQRHEVRARVLRRHSDRNACAMSVLAQATGDSEIYKADGSVALRFSSI
jgi:flagellar biosynthesis/type III secretory pathway chaperone